MPLSGAPFMDWGHITHSGFSKQAAKVKPPVFPAKSQPRTSRHINRPAIWCNQALTCPTKGPIPPFFAAYLVWGTRGGPGPASLARGQGPGSATCGWRGRGVMGIPVGRGGEGD